jgi:hypothetical protein
MKPFILFTTIILLFSFCKKKNETPDFATLIVGKWVCNSYKKDDADTIENRQPLMMSLFYDSGWDFFQNKQMRFKNAGLGWAEKATDNVDYILTGNKTLTINIFDPILSTNTKIDYDIIVFSANKLTVHCRFWKATFYLLKE